MSKAESQISDSSPSLKAAMEEIAKLCAELKRERDEALEALRKAIRFVEAFEPCSRGTEVDQNETLAIARKALEAAK